MSKQSPEKYVDLPWLETMLRIKNARKTEIKSTLLNKDISLSSSGFQRLMLLSLRTEVIQTRMGN
jgi:hypothetical protein